MPVISYNVSNDPVVLSFVAVNTFATHVLDVANVEHRLAETDAVYMGEPTAIDARNRTVSHSRKHTVR